MKDAGEHIEILIAKYLTEEATAAERAELQEWLALSAENQNYFEDSKRLFAAFEATAHNWQPSVDSAWNTLNQRVSEEGKVIPLWRQAIVYRSVAAIFIAVFAIFIYTRLFREEPVLVSLHSETSVLKSKLPDGSQVTLNKGASISYKLSKGRRHVDLKGEAYFAVVHDSVETFEVQAGEVLIQDIGTAFNVKYPSDGLMEVSVDEGEVAISKDGLQSLNLKAGEVAVYDANKQLLYKREVLIPENAGAYATKDFNFSGVKLAEVIRQLNEAYQVNIQIVRPEMRNCLFSVSFYDEQLDMVLSVIAETLDFEIEKQGKNILLKKGTCL